MLREALTSLAVALPFGMGVTTAPAGPDPRPAFRFEDPAIVESSGLAVVDDLVVTVNDSGDEARVFTVDPSSGRTVGVTRWEGGTDDVEALAPARSGTVWVGDIGDNGRSRDTISVTQVPVGRGDRSVAGATYRLRYPDGAHDAEALLTIPATGQLLVATKEIFGGVLYAAPERLDPERVNRLRPLGTVMGVATGGEFFPDGRHLVLRDYGRAVVYTWPGLEAVGEVDLPPQQQGEGIAVVGRDDLLVGSEGPRSPVHRLELPPDVAEAVAPPPTSSSDRDPGDASVTRSREGEELPEDDPGPRDPTQWLIGTGLLVVALLVLWRALRPRRTGPLG